MKRIIITLLVVTWLLSACVANTEKSVDVQPETVTGTTNTEYTKEYQYHDKTLYIGDFQPIEDNFFMDIAEEYKGYTIGIYETDELTEKKLTNRTDRNEVIIERIIGIVTDEQRNGQILSTVDTECNYISYKTIAENVTYNVGDVILTYCVYNPVTNYTDDIIDRFEFNLDVC